jgi:tyramine---L-glutamate ligase
VTSERSASQEVAENLSAKRIFVSEYVCGGGWPAETLEPSLALEGRAMLLAVVSDLLRVPGCKITTTWDLRLGQFPISEVGAVDEAGCDAALRLDVHKIDSPSEALRFEELCRSSDAALVIAPEFHGILARRTANAARHTALLGSDVAAIELCSDKLRLAEFLAAHGIPTIPTAALDLAEPEVQWPYPIVMKPRDGAGSLDTFYVEDARQMESCCRNARESDSDENGRPAFKFIQQPFIGGETLSAAVLCEAGGAREFLPVCRQVLSDDGRFQYLGADWDPVLTSVWQGKAIRLMNRVLGEISGLSGYVGFDLIADEAGSVQIVEVNPRLTTGYLTWQSRLDANLAERILESRKQECGGISAGKTRRRYS